ncbi:nucleotidyltransferase family protein, partial [Oenococcus oeni]
MEATGLITEYNPFHNGHLYHLKKAQELTKADVTIVLMSGNWVQRGLPAITDKWKRAQAAIDAGADLVFELPFYYAVQAGEIFAQGAVRLLSDLQVSSIIC